MTLDGRNREIILDRMHGKTLEEIGIEQNITRERIRQICSKIFKKKPKLFDDRFRYWFEQYNLNEDDMQNIFGISKLTYGYLKQNYKQGSKDITMLEFDVNISVFVYKKFKEQIKKYCVYINNHYVPIERAILLTEIIKAYCKTEVHIENLFNFYFSYLEDNNLNENSKLTFPNKRSFEARVQDDKNSLWKFGRKVRYYPIENYDVCEFVSELNLDRFKDVEISTLLLLNDNKELMKQYDIRDEYELHNFLKKTESKWNKDNKYEIEFARMPMLTFGNVDRKKQYSTFLEQIAPVTLEEYGQLCEMEFGILSQTAMANHLSYIGEYYHKGIFEANQPLLTDNEILNLEQVLNQEFYLLEDVKKIIFSILPNLDVSKLNARNYKRLGYKVFSGYLIKNTYSSAQEYFENLFLKSEILNLNDIDSRILFKSVACNLLYELREQNRLIEIEDKVYIRQDRFERITNHNISKNYDFIHHVLSFSKDYVFFTMKKLFADGFYDELLDIDMGIYFYSALVKNSQLIKYIKMGNNILFYSEDNSVTSVDFFQFILEEKISMDIYDFIDFIADEYDIELQKDKVVYWIGQSELYYDSTMEKIYLNKDAYYEDID